MFSTRDKTLRPLVIFLASKEPAWISLLESEGIAWEVLDYTKLAEVNHEVIVLPYRTPIQVRRACFDLSREGATVITEIHQPDIPATDQRESLSFAYHDEDFSGLKNKELPNAIRILSDNCGEGKYYQLPFKLADLWNSHYTDKKYLIVDPVKEIIVFERMAKIVKKNVRRVILEIIRRSFFDRQLPLVHKWYWPDNNRSVFCLRGDMDGGPKENFHQFLETVSPFSSCVSLFACAGTYYQKKDLIKKALDAGIEVQNHTFAHYVFPDKITNKLNLTKAEDLLAAAGTKTCGFVAPAYFWNPGIYSILENRGYQYSSCFGLDHDNMPYFPVVNKKLGKVLEIPFHCLGDFFPKFNIEMDGPITRQFFSELLAKKYAAGEPMYLYGHPDMHGRLGCVPELVRFIYQQVVSHSDVWTGQLHQLASWCRQRNNFSFKPYIDWNQRCLVCNPYSDSTYDNNPPMISIQMPNGDWYLTHPRQCQRPGFHLDSAKSLPPLKPPQATDVGEVIHVPDSPTVRSRMGYRKRELKRMIRKYREIYFTQHDL